MRQILPILVFTFAVGGVHAAQPSSHHGKSSAKSHATEKHEKGHWGYSGHSGPAHWAELDPAFAACGIGRQQSPINIETAFTQSLDQLQIHYRPGKLAVTNNGHTIQHPVDPGSFLEIGPERYELLQFHFHAPSEEAIGGKRYAMDIHLVHKNPAGKLAVLTVLIEQGKNDHPAFKELWKSLPPADETRIFEKKHYSAASVLPANLSYWTFMGSLTTPPCSEGVRWLVLRTPIQLSKKQIDSFKRLYPMNARPIQPLNERAVLSQP